METYLLLLACLQPTLINKTNSPWDNNDKRVLERAAYVCKVRYPSEPCLKTFIKKPNRTYNAICGQVDERR